MALLVFAAPARAALPGAQISATDVIPRVDYPGLQQLHYVYGPITIHPGQNSIETGTDLPRPSVPGYITRFAPNLVYADTGAVPRVDVIHLHHGVWVVNGYPTFAAGEEKTILQLPQGFGFGYQPSDSWVLSYMIHDLTPKPAKVYLTYDIDFLPAPAALTPVHPLWLDVAGIRGYPVFDAPRNGKRYTFPDDAKGAARAAIGPAQTYTVPSDITLVAAGGHLHPGGLYNDITAHRGSRAVRVFRSQAKYFEPAGAVSWDVATTVTKPNWRVALHAGDKLSLSVTYDTRKAAWYESMGIAPVFYADGDLTGAPDPFTSAVDTTGLLTHGHLPENSHHGGGVFGLPDPRELLAGPRLSRVSIGGFLYTQGDLSLNAKDGRPPVVPAGGSITFKNYDATAQTAPSLSAYHTITACRAPCNRGTGIAYPLADGQFDSGELGYGPPGYTPAANRNTWSTPKNLSPGTYTYFCRIHPYMRGSFRVTRR